MGLLRPAIPCHGETTVQLVKWLRTFTCGLGPGASIPAGADSHGRASVPARIGPVGQRESCGLDGRLRRKWPDSFYRRVLICEAWVDRPTVPGRVMETKARSGVAAQKRRPGRPVSTVIATKLSVSPQTHAPLPKQTPQGKCGNAAGHVGRA
jgi:hypothetical protein